MREPRSELLKHRISAALFDASLAGAFPSHPVLMFGAIMIPPIFLSGCQLPLVEYLVALLELLTIFFLDGLFVIVGPSLIFFVALGGGGMFGGGIIALFASASIITHWLYHANQESSEDQATFGMRKFGLKLQTKSKTKVSFARASLRHFSKIISTAALFLGFAQVLWSPGARALHDAISGTIVADAANPELEENELNAISSGGKLVALFGICVLALGIGLPISYDTPYRTMHRAREESIKNNYENAEQLYLKALQQAEHFNGTIEQVVFGRKGDAVADTLEALAEFYGRRKNFAQAAKIYERLTPMYERYEKSYPEKLALELEAFANSYYMSDQFQAAAPLYQRVMGLYKEKEPSSSVGFNQHLQRLAYAKMEDGHYKEADDLFKRAIASMNK